MSDAHSQRNVPKRQIARLIGSSIFPIWVLSEDSQLVFANESFVALFPELGPDPLGLECSIGAQESSPERTLLARWLALPTNGSSQWIRCIKDKLPSGLPEADRSAWIDRLLVRWILPLDESQEPSYLCVLKPDRGDCEAILEGDFHHRIEVPALSILEQDANLDGLWFLQGQTLASQTLRKQLQLAVHGEHPLCLIGQPGNYIVQLASLIFKERRVHRGLPPTPIAPFTIDCSLMDKDLLQSTLEWIDDTRRKNVLPQVVLYRLEMLAQELREGLARVCREQKWEFITTLEQDAQSSVDSGGEAWQWLISNAQTQEIRIPPLCQRTQEIESLLFALMRRSPTTRWTPSFLEALLAYSWPGGIDEMHQAFEQAMRASGQDVLEEAHLPISIRTFPSHIERPTSQETIELDQVLERLERMLIERALSSYPKNNSAAAKSLGISRARLLRRMQQWGLGAERSTSIQQDEVIFEELDRTQDSEGN